MAKNINISLRFIHKVGKNTKQQSICKKARIERRINVLNTLIRRLWMKKNFFLCLLESMDELEKKIMDILI